MLGVLNIYKPVGPTSHDVVARVRRVLGIRRVGHSGTLDPLADGVLLVAVGPATRLVEYLNDLPKTYLARLRFGQATDTQDASGTVLEERDAGRLTAEQVRTALERFTGTLEQVPPMFSAVKVGGRPLYERARRGEVVERRARTVTIHRLEMLEFQPGTAAEAALRIDCSSGTYVRTLCHDLGERVGTLATMTALTRAAIGPFSGEESISLEELERRSAAAEPLPWIAPAAAVAHLPACRVDAEQAAALRQGKRVVVRDGAGGAAVRILDRAGELVAIGRSEPVDGDAGHGFRIAPEKVFTQADASL